VAVNAPIAPITTAVNFPLSFPGPLDMRGGLARQPLIASVSDSLSIIVALITPTSTEMVSSFSKIRIVVVSSMMPLSVLVVVPQRNGVDVDIVARPTQCVDCDVVSIGIYRKSVSVIRPNET